MDNTKLFAAQSALSYVEDKILNFRTYTIDAIKSAVSILGGKNISLDLYLSAPHDVTCEENCSSIHHVTEIFTADDYDGETYVICEILGEYGGQITEALEELSANELYEIAKSLEQKLQNISN